MKDMTHPEVEMKYIISRAPKCNLWRRSRQFSTPHKGESDHSKMNKVEISSRSL
jgi:hypothetical protein